MRFREKKAAEAAIDMTPMIDMVFILLIFFMVSTTFVKDMQIDIERPGAATQTVSSTKAVRLYIDKAGEVYMDGAPVRVWVIASRLRDQLQGQPQKSVLVVTDEGVPAGRLVEVVDQARQAGAEVGVATRGEAGEG
ncbi:MAG: biopolymer transporter ExbD [Pseudoxanthomonas sp.]|nr:biopolymer transporter ExbD [Pseudoxanthomonas sp.]